MGNVDKSDELSFYVSFHSDADRGGSGGEGGSGGGGGGGGGGRVGFLNKIQAQSSSSPSSPPQQNAPSLNQADTQRQPNTAPPLQAPTTLPSNSAVGGGKGEGGKGGGGGGYYTIGDNLLPEAAYPPEALTR